MISTTMNLSTYKAVVVLNNTGVTLLQRQRFHDAMTTLKDATDLMSCVRDDDRRLMGAEKAAIFLDQASARIAKSTRIGGGDQKKAESKCSISVIHQGECTKEVLSTFPELFHGFAYILVYADDCINVFTDTAMLLHNFSVSIRMNVQHVGIRNHNIAGNNKMMNFAYRVESAAGKILNDYMATSANDCFIELQGNRNSEETCQLAIVVVKDLILFLRMGQQVGDNENIYEKYTEQKYIEQLQQLRSALLVAQASKPNHSLLKFTIGAQAA